MVNLIVGFSQGMAEALVVILQKVLIEGGQILVSLGISRSKAAAVEMEELQVFSFLQLLSLLSHASLLRLLVPGALVLFRASLTAEEILSLMFSIEDHVVITN